MHRHFLGLLLALTAACTAEQDRAEKPVVKLTCGLDSARFLAGDGIGDFRVRASVEDVRAACVVVRDTSLELGAEGMPERRIAVQLDQDTIEATVHQGRVWRIELRSPRFRTSDSLGVGSSVKVLRQHPTQYLGYGKGGPFVRVLAHCGLSFRLAVPGFAKTWNQVPNTATVDEVLILGCR